MAFRTSFAWKNFSVWKCTGYSLYYMTWFPVVLCINTLVVETTRVTGGSMYPFFNEDRDTTLRRDLAVNWKLLPDVGLARGMIVTFKSPLNPGSYSVKRITALEGDLVRGRNHPTICVPKGHIWVEGDAGTDRESVDSNTYGPISKRLVTGRLTHIIYPFKKFGAIRWWEHPVETRSSWRHG